MAFVEIFNEDLFWALPELFRGLGARSLLAWGGIVSTSSEKGYPVVSIPRRRLCVQLLLLTSFLVLTSPAWDGRGRAMFSDSLYIDVLGRGSQFVLLRSGVGCFLVRLQPAFQRRLLAFEYSILRVFARLGRRLLASANDLLALYLALELQSLCLYMMAAFGRGSAYSTEAGLKYFILGALASGMLLFGASLIYGTLGTTSYVEIASLLSLGGEGIGRGLLLGIGFILAAVRWKLALAPFHAWSPDVLEGAPRPSARYLAVVTKLTSVMALIRLIFGPFYGLRLDIRPLLRFVSARSRVIAALGALRASRVKRFLAYSSIGHRGYLLLGVSCGTLEGLQGGLVYARVYVIGARTVWGSLRVCGRGPSEPVRYMTDLGGLGQENPTLARTLARGRFSRAGMPPRIGFAAKFRVFFAARESGLWRLARLGVLTSVIGAWYYLKWVKVRYFEGGSRTGSAWVRPREASRVLGTSLRRRTFFFRNPQLLLGLTHQRALGLCM